GEHPNICVECGKSFAQTSALLAHRRSSHGGHGGGGDKPFACLDCGKSFGLSANLLRHRRSHANGSPRSCRDCGKEVGAAAANPPRPAGQKPYKCVDCGKSFGRPKQPPGASPAPAGRQRQRRRWDDGEKAPAVPIPNTCGECWQSFSQNSDLVKHMRIH
ncbi:ZN252 protein, partial [Uria aalge]|nr:ZN252 protein [Uria aalge]